MATGVEASKNVSQFVLIFAAAPVVEDGLELVAVAAGVVAADVELAGAAGVVELPVPLLPHAVAMAASAQAATICAICR
ncbi:MAG TPA: hypothetical protein VGI66_16955 [Streptosporangiaceae bacterium]